MICAAASPSADTTFTVEHVRVGTIHRPTELVRVAGGKGLNVARAASWLGADPLVVALLPKQGASWLRSELERDGIRLLAVEGPTQLRQCLSVFDVESHSLTEFYEPGNEIEEPSWRGFADAVASECQRGTWLALCGSLPLGAPVGAYADLALAAGDRGSQVALDADGTTLQRAAAAGPTLIKVNETEARTMLGQDEPQATEDEAAADSAAAVADVARRMLALGPSGQRVAIVTRGSRGALLVRPGETALAATPNDGPAARYPVGSGDAFLAGLLTAREDGADWEAALRLAVGAGTANAEMIGPGRLDPDRAYEIADQVSISTVG
jgi:1-phosphofructokinase family hexose kinase